MGARLAYQWCNLERHGTGTVTGTGTVGTGTVGNGGTVGRGGSNPGNPPVNPQSVNSPQ